MISDKNFCYTIIYRLHTITYYSDVCRAYKCEPHLSAYLTCMPNKHYNTFNIYKIFYISKHMLSTASYIFGIQFRFSPWLIACDTLSGLFFDKISIYKWITHIALIFNIAWNLIDTSLYLQWKWNFMNLNKKAYVLYIEFAYLKLQNVLWLINQVINLDINFLSS